ncbi:MAG: glycosyltransferase family 2 protein [Caldilineaceae bacterium]|nr:glycosyltransferase family 2 protein [Caldilineaceae bacterium]
MKLKAYQLHERAVSIQPAAQENVFSPANTLNGVSPVLHVEEQGWRLCCPYAVEMTWNGGPSADDIALRCSEPLNADEPGFVQPKTNGRFTLHSGYQFKIDNSQIDSQIDDGQVNTTQTDGAALLWVRGPINQPKDGLAPREQFVDAATFPCTISIDWQFTRPNQAIRFAAGEPFCTLVPVPQHFTQPNAGELDIDEVGQNEDALYAYEQRFRRAAQAQANHSFFRNRPRAGSRRYAYSVIIPTINEGARLWFTLHSMLLAWEAQGNSGLDADHEVIVVDSGSQDDTVKFLQEPVMQQYVRLIQTNVSGPGPVRQVGAEAANGEVLFFMDAHVLVPPTFFGDVVAAMKQPGIWEQVGAMHFPISSRGGLQDARTTHYELTLEQDFWGVQRLGDFRPQAEPLEIAASSHATVAVRQAHFDAVGGYNIQQSQYGGDETYLDLKFARFGYRNYVYMGTHVSHCTMRQMEYEWSLDTLFRNNVISAYVLGGKPWAEKLLAHRLAQPDVEPERVHKLYRQALALAQRDFEFVQTHAQYTLEEVLQRFAERNVPR